MYNEKYNVSTSNIQKLNLRPILDYVKLYYMCKNFVSKEQNKNTK